jgi:GNAT superfamily N-acetyltransferase
MIDQVRIESAVPDDISDLVALDVWLTNSGRQEQIIRESIAQRTCFVARTEELPAAGFVTWNRSFFNRPFVWLLVVRSNHRRRGIGRMLLAKVEEVCGDDIFVSTERINSGMQTLLEGMGYAHCGEIEYINPLGNPELFFYKRLNGTDDSMAFPFDR